MGGGGCCELDIHIIYEEDEFSGISSPKYSRGQYNDTTNEKFRSDT